MSDDQVASKAVGRSEILREGHARIAIQGPKIGGHSSTSLSLVLNCQNMEGAAPQVYGPGKVTVKNIDFFFEN